MFRALDVREVAPVFIDTVVDAVPIGSVGLHAVDKFRTRPFVHHRNNVRSLPQNSDAQPAVLEKETRRLRSDISTPFSFLESDFCPTVRAQDKGQ